MKAKIIVSIIVGVIFLTFAGILIGFGVKNNSNNIPVTKTYALETEFENIDINVTSANVNFKVSEDDTKKVVVSESNIRYHKVEVVDKTLKIQSIDSTTTAERILLFDLIQKEVDIYLPSRSYNDLKITDMTGNVTLPQQLVFNTFKGMIMTGSITISSNILTSLNVLCTTGDIDISNCTLTKPNLIATAGKVTMSNVNIYGDLEVKSETGGMRFEKLDVDNMELTSTTGNIMLNTVIVRNHAGLSTTSGLIEMLSFDANTVFVVSNTGDIMGSFLTPKTFHVKGGATNVDVPSTTGSLCEIVSGTGSVQIWIKKQ